jgi:hypothetical protein
MFFLKICLVGLYLANVSDCILPSGAIAGKRFGKEVMDTILPRFNNLNLIALYEKIDPLISGMF